MKISTFLLDCNLNPWHDEATLRKISSFKDQTLFVRVTPHWVPSLLKKPTTSWPSVIFIKKIISGKAYGN
jgi:hypothetical protein